MAYVFGDTMICDDAHPPSWSPFRKNFGGVRSVTLMATFMTLQGL